MFCEAKYYKIVSQLFVAIFFSTLLVSCEGESSSNSIDDANIECGGSSEVTIDGRNVCPNNE